MLSAAEIDSGSGGLRTTQRAFLEALAKTGSMTAAAASIGISRDTPYGWLAAEGYSPSAVEDEESPPDGTFAHALRQAKSMAAEHALGKLHDIVDKAEGMPSAISAMFTVKRWYPQYRDQLNVKHSGAVLQARVDLNQLSPTERVELAGLLHRRLLAGGSGESDVAVDEEVSEDGGG